MQSIGIPGDPGLCRAQNSLDGNMASEIGQLPPSRLCRAQHDQNGELGGVPGGGGGAWASLGNSAPVIMSEVAEVRTIQQIKRLCTCSQLASLGILGSAEPRTLQMVIWRLKLVNSLHLGSAEPSMTKMVN